MAKSKSKKDSVIKPYYNMRNFIVSCYLLLMFSIFELILTNAYANARKDKYYTFCILTTALIVSVLVISIEYFVDRKSENAVRTLEQKPIFSLSVTDIAMFLFLIFAVITTLLSSYKLDSIFGTAGRNNGLLLIALYTALYFIISRFYFLKDYVLAAFIVFGSIISLLTIINFFYIDPLGFSVGLNEEEILNFGTTIGNKNYISMYMCIFLPVAMSMFVVYKKLYMQVLSAIGIVFGYCGLLCASSNSSYIGLFAMLFAMTVAFLRNPYHCRKYILALLIMISSGKVLRLFSLIMSDHSKGFESIGQMLIYSGYTYIIIGLLLAIAVVLYLTKDSDFVANKWPKTTLTIASLVAFVGIIVVVAYMFIHYSFINKTKDIGELSKLLRFDERWGTHRGFFWIKGMEEFKDFNLLEKLFGSGCDTFAHVFERYFRELDLKFGNTMTDCAHNEYINYLVTQGILGLASYLTVIISVVYRAFRVSGENKLALIFVMPVVAYSAQAVVNIYNPVVTPLLFIFIALCECVNRKSCTANIIE